MSLFAAAELASLRSLAESAMGDTVTIVTTTTVSDGAGGQTESTTTTTSRGRLQLASGSETQSATQIQARGQYRLSLPVTTTVSPTDQIQVGGRTFEIRWAPPVVNHSVVRTLGLEEIS